MYRNRPYKSETNRDGVSAGQLRKQLIASSVKQATLAIKSGFYIEAIALCESLIGDREESLLADLDPYASAYQPAGTLATLLLKDHSHELSDDLVKLIQDDYMHTPYSRTYKWRGEMRTKRCKTVLQWCFFRNRAMHELAKLDPKMRDTFADKYARLKTVAEEGIILFHELSHAVEQCRKDLCKG